ncbi:MAG TPA: nicotinamide riboside transporter PnuC [Ohtaekwangia sp.]|nr:nicotinamide riboside transporter PnuC [Ohtaekwangia sp.]
MNFFDINHIFFTAWRYDVSYLEFFGLVSGVIAVTLSSRANVWSWPVGIVNVVLSFFLFYQVQLYPDMFLQMFFFVTNILGWWRWLNPKPGEEDRKKELRVSFLKLSGIIVILAVTIGGTFLMGKFAQHLHSLLPTLFKEPSAYPYADSFIMVMSIVTTFYMIQKKIECWIIWILVDVVATYLYYIRDLKLYSLLYFVFCFIAAYGLYHWIKEYRSYQTQSK